MAEGSELRGGNERADGREAEGGLTDRRPGAGPGPDAGPDPETRREPEGHRKPGAGGEPGAGGPSGDRPAGPAAAGSRTKLRDRDSEVHSAELAVEKLCREFAAGGTEIGELLIFSGQAGLGKTSLLHEVRRRAHTRERCTVLFARGGEQQYTEPYHVLRQLLQPVLGGLTEPERHEVFGNWYDTVGPAIGLFRPGSEAVAIDPQGIRDGLDYVLTQLAPRRAPLVMIVDDLHWADLESLSWLSAFAVRSRELPVLLVTAYRDGDEFTPEALPFQQAIAGQATRRHELRPLTPDSMSEIVRDALGPGAEEPFCYEVWSVTRGNPYDATALIGKVIDQDLEPVEENTPMLGELAAEARGMTLKTWLEKLGTTTLRFAWAAALLGTDINPGLATRISALSQEAARESVKQLRKHRVLTQVPGGNLEFVHPLIGTSIYKTMPDAARTGMHGVAFTEIENAGLGLIAASRHLIATHPEGDDRTVRKLRRAAAEHLAIGAPEAAQACLKRALSEPPDEDYRAEVLYELGCSALLTDPVATVNQLRLALDPDEGLRPELRVDATFRLSEALAHSGQLIAAAQVCKDEIARTKDPAGRLRLEAASLMWQAWQKAEEDGPARSRRLEELWRGLQGRGTAERAVLAMRAWDLTLRGEPAAVALSLVEEALEDGRLPDGLQWTNTTWGFELPAIIGLTCTYTDRLALAERLFSDAIMEFELAGWSGAHRGFAYFLMGLTRFRRGLLAEAEDFLRRGLRLSERIGPGLPLQWDTVGVLIDTLLARGRVDEAWELSQKYNFGPPYHPTAMVLPDAPSLYGKLLLAKGKHVAAAATLTRVGGELAERGWHNTVWAPWAGHLAVALAREDPDRAWELAEESVERAMTFGAASAIGTALRLHAEIADGPKAVELLELAVTHLGQSPAGYEHAVALVDLGCALRRVGRLEDAAEYLYQGIELAQHCAADGLVDRARRELAKSGLRPNRLRSVSKDALSQPEWEVAALAVKGVPAPRIAQELGVPLSLVHRRLAAVHRKAGTGTEGLAAALGLSTERPDPTED
ncbi:ATP-binding protein [Kitasatospora indigofera]|uniref:ATP-binding protein n=1 Tax=Kitasatospora indigofera TaxID=67307 RepID=UPI003679A4FD